ncbi:MAG: CARDB domain-containing protein, partial [Owenweeksia sp.]
VQIISNGFEGREQRYYSRNEAIQLIDELKPSQAYRTASEIRSRVAGPWEDINTSKGELQVFILSDFQRSQFNDLASFDQEDWNTHFIRFEAANKTPNVAIDSVWFDQPILQPGFDQEVQVHISNYGDEAITGLSIKLEINNELVAAREFEISANSEEEISFTIRPEARGNYRGKVSLDAGEPYFDNEFHFAFNLSEPIRILAIGEAHRETLERLYQDEVYQLSITPLNRINYGELNSYKLVILDGLTSFPSGLQSALESNLSEGGNIVVLPSLQDQNGDQSVLQGLGIRGYQGISETERQGSEVAYNDLLFENVFTERSRNLQLPYAQNYIRLSNSGGYRVISLENGDPLLMRYPRENGQVVVWTTSLDADKSSLGRHPILVPIMLNAALYSNTRSPLYNAAGRNSGQQFEQIGNAEVPLAVDINGQTLIPPQRNRGKKTEIYSLPSEVEPGIYPVQKDGNTLGLVAVNVDPRESDWSFWTAAELENTALSNAPEILEGNASLLGNRIHTLYNGYPLWRWFLAGALLFLVLEMLLLKLWK